MACPAISTGASFLSGTLAHIDCQARTIGSYGYGALADPHSMVFIALTGLLTIFIALHGVRLLLGHAADTKSIVGDVIKVGIVLTLATSWPAWRTIGFDVIMNGPLELAQTVGLASGLSEDSGDASARLQALDDGIVVMTSYGTGRLTGGVAAGDELGDSFRGVALADQFALGMGRAAFLVGTLVPFGIFRLGAGILLALAPLVAGSLLFGGTIGIFLGWIRGLALCALGYFALVLVQGVEIALLEPWLQTVIANRQGGAFTPSAPTELFVLSLTFSGISLGVLLLFGRLTFFSAQASARFSRIPADLGWRDHRGAPQQSRSSEMLTPSRAQVIAEVVGGSMRREQPKLRDAHSAESSNPHRAVSAAFSSSSSGGDNRAADAADAGKRRTVGRTSAAGQLRDRKP